MSIYFVLLLPFLCDTDIFHQKVFLQTLMDTSGDFLSFNLLYRNCERDAYSFMGDASEKKGQKIISTGKHRTLTEREQRHLTLDMVQFQIREKIIPTMYCFPLTHLAMYQALCIQDGGPSLHAGLLGSASQIRKLRLIKENNFPKKT